MANTEKDFIDRLIEKEMFVRHMEVKRCYSDFWAD